MKELKKENIKEFLDYYHYLHDSFITHIHYDINKAEIHFSIDISWIGNQKKNNMNYVLDKQKLSVVFSAIKEYRCKELSLSDYIDKVYISELEIEGEKYMIFSSGLKKPLVYIVCGNIQYENIIL